MGVALVRGGLTLLLIQLALLQPSKFTSSGRQVGFSKRLIYQPAGAVVCSDKLLRRTDQCMQRILLELQVERKGRDQGGRKVAPWMIQPRVNLVNHRQHLRYLLFNQTFAPRLERVTYLQNHQNISVDQDWNIFTSSYHWAGLAASHISQSIQSYKGGKPFYHWICKFGWGSVTSCISCQTEKQIDDDSLLFSPIVVSKELCSRFSFTTFSIWIKLWCQVQLNQFGKRGLTGETCSVSEEMLNGTKAPGY